MDSAFAWLVIIGREVLGCSSGIAVSFPLMTGDEGAVVNFWKSDVSVKPVVGSADNEFFKVVGSAVKAGDAILAGSTDTAFKTGVAA